jgi:hypothetical protein
LTVDKDRAEGRDSFNLSSDVANHSKFKMGRLLSFILESVTAG